MDFRFTEEQELFRKTVREFCQKKLEPRAREIDTKGEIPRDLVKEMGKMGLLAMTVSEDYGGQNADWVTACIACEEIARADLSCATAVLFLVQAAWGFIFDRYGTEEAKEEVLPKVTSGEWFLGIATTEPDAGSDVRGAKTKLERKNGKWVINGEKAYISGVREASTWGGGHLTLAWTSPEKEKGMTFAFVPLKDTPGIETSLYEDMGRMGISTGAFSMDNVELPDHYIIGEVDRGFYYAMEGYNAARVLIGACCAGVGLKALEIGMDYIKQRKAFGRPIGKFEGIQFRLAEEYTKMHMSWMLAYYAAWTMDEYYKKKSVTLSQVNLAVAMSKYYVPWAAFHAVNEAMQWHGAYGYTKECPLEMGLRGVRSYSIGAEGSPEIMKIIIGRELLGREFVPYR